MTAMATWTPGTWWITPHAARSMVDRGFTRRQVLDAATEPHHSYPSSKRHPGYETREVRVRGDVTVVVDLVSRDIITVMNNDPLAQHERWIAQGKVTLPDEPDHGPRCSSCLSPVDISTGRMSVHSRTSLEGQVERCMGSGRTLDDVVRLVDGVGPRTEWWPTTKNP